MTLRSAAKMAATAWPSLFRKALKAAFRYRGPLGDMVHQTGRRIALRHGLLGWATIADLQQKARFVRISGAGLRESHVHDVIITREAPNYRVE